LCSLINRLRTGTSAKREELKWDDSMKEDGQENLSFPIFQ
jgi:hypothetical protein